MNSELARVLNVLAHEIRTPLAVSQGYLKLMAEGRLGTAAEQAAAIERTREALGRIVTLCTDMGRLGALIEGVAPHLPGRVSVASLLDEVNDALVRHAPLRSGATAPGTLIATDGTHDLATAVAALGTMACADAGPDDKVMAVTNETGTSMTLRVGSGRAVAALPPHADAPEAAVPLLVRGGFGLSLLWAAAVLARHGVRTWQSREPGAAVGVTFPVVSA